MRPAITSTISIIAVTLAISGCPKEKQPGDDGAGAETTGPRPAAEPDPSSAGETSGSETGTAAAATCEDDLAKAKAELAACVAAQG